MGSVPLLAQGVPREWSGKGNHDTSLLWRRVQVHMEYSIVANPPQADRDLPLFSCCVGLWVLLGNGRVLLRSDSPPVLIKLVCLSHLVLQQAADSTTAVGDLHDNLQLSTLVTSTWELRWTLRATMLFVPAESKGCRCGFGCLCPTVMFQKVTAREAWSSGTVKE